MLFAIYFLKEKVGLIRWSAAIFSFLGGLLLIRPNLSFDFNPYALLCIFGAVSMGLEIICIKYLSNKEDIFRILLINNAHGCKLYKTDGSVQILVDDTKFQSGHFFILLGIKSNYNFS